MLDEMVEYQLPSAWSDSASAVCLPQFCCQDGDTSVLGTGGWTEAETGRHEWRSVADGWVGADVSWVLIVTAISVLALVSSYTSLHLCQWENTQVGCVSYWVFVDPSNLFISTNSRLVLWPWKDAITYGSDSVRTLIFFLTSWASSHLSLFSSINRLLTDCTKLWKMKAMRVRCNRTR